NHYFNGDICIHHENQWTEMMTPDDQDLQTLFYRVNNAFIQRFTLSFRRENRAFPYYIRAKANDLHCKVDALRVEGEGNAEIDYVLVSFLGLHLKPQVYETWMLRELHEDYIMLFAHDSFRRIVTSLVYD
ncbi:hypothetical protein AAVH_19868, partial [Aphelenchoides avenae]